MAHEIAQKLHLEEGDVTVLPEKVTRVIGLKLCPPSGLYLQIFMMVVNEFLDFFNVLTLFVKGDIMFALSLGFFHFIAVFITCMVSVTVKGGLCTLVGISVRSGVMEPTVLWELFFGVLYGYSGGFKALLAPYAMLLATDLKLFAGLNAALSLVSNASTLGGYIAISHLGMKPQAGEAVVKRQSMGSVKWSLFKLFMLCHVAAVVSSNAIIARTYHPLVAIVLFMPVAYANSTNGTGIGMCSSFCGPLFLCGPWFTSVFGLQCQNYDKKMVEEQKKNPPAFTFVMAHFLRMVAICGLLFLDFPNTPYGRPMGRSAFMQMTEPVSEAYNWLLELNEDGELGPRAIMEHLSGNAVLIFAILAIAAITVPIQIFGSFGLLMCNKSYRTGEWDNDAIDLQASIWAELYEKLYNAYRSIVKEGDDPNGTFKKYMEGNRDFVPAKDS